MYLFEIQVMMEFGVKKIVFSSSATVYGDPEYLPVDEKHPTGKCTNPYGKTKYFMEEIIKDQCAANHVSNYGVPIIDVKVRNMKMDFNTGGTWRQVMQ